jgi:gamma-glutamyltranspeptidase / glutathione hydrolase
VAAIAISAPNRLAAQAGASLAEAGGNAVDAAVAAAMVAATTEPGMTSLGGAAYATIRPPGGSGVLTVDGGAAVPGLGLGLDSASFSEPDLHPLAVMYGGRALGGYCGWASAGTPGCIAALHRTHDLFGDRAWRDVLGPAIETAGEGFPLSTSAALYLSEAATRVFARDSEVAAVVLDADGEAVKAGTMLRIPHLDGFLRRLADGGPEVFYRGSIASRLANAMRVNGGLVTLQDLESYEPVLRTSAAARFGDWEILTNPAPALGGRRVLSLLSRLESAWSGRSHADQLATIAVSMSELLKSDPVWSGTGNGSVESPSTAHVSAVDSAGLACAITFSAGYGAGVAVPQTGIWLGNSLGEVELNDLGLYERLAGNRIASNMTPSVAIQDGGTVIAIGTPGADRIVSALAVVLASAMFGGGSVAEAISRSRVHVGFPEPSDERQTLDIEEGADVDQVLDLNSFVHRVHPRHSMFFGAVTAAILHRDGRLEALTDPRRDGAGRVVRP